MAQHHRHTATIAAATLAATLGACTGGAFDTHPVCVKPHGGANVQLAPAYQCETRMQGRRWVNR